VLAILMNDGVTDRAELTIAVGRDQDGLRGDPAAGRDQCREFCPLLAAS
jgi:hypothetical protein